MTIQGVKSGQFFFGGGCIGLDRIKTYLPSTAKPMILLVNNIMIRTGIHLQVNIAFVYACVF